MYRTSLLSRFTCLTFKSYPLRLPSQSIRNNVVVRCQPEQGQSAQDLLLAEDCPVPKEQQPLYELKSLEQMMMFNWATLPLKQFVQKLIIVYGGFLVFVGLPISAFTFDPFKEPVQFLSSASIGCLFIVIVTVLRLYLGWAHVGNRLLSATVEYEETGWYDGQVWVKPPQVLMRDRLLGNYTVKPTLQRLRNTLVSLAGGLAATVAILVASPPPSMQSLPSLTPIGYVGSSSRQVAMENYEQNVQIYEQNAQDSILESEDEDMQNIMYNYLGHGMQVYQFNTET
eukprot:TRINITY_DN3441_c1_g1_i1.p1 TRINITY_DN3441_c1_g1~~TRINITY_DN3441_c1_g1_i1.p1  ORF type:complete len:313 (-),score=10.74 TRINITY_DN3441_c1_g1_i1:488-1339(-)